MTLEEMKQKKKETGLSYGQISERSGVPLGTVQKVFTGITKSPRYATLQALERAFREEALQEDAFHGDRSSHKAERSSAVYSTAYSTTSPAPKVLAETPGHYYTDGNTARSDDSTDRDIAWSDRPSGARSARTFSNHSSAQFPRQGTYTLSDYLALPEDLRVELIDGTFYTMLAPSIPHQLISYELTHFFSDFIDENGGPCLAVSSPVDVQLDQDDKTIVEPDVCVVCDQDKVTFARIYGAPDLVVEVLSKSTRQKDLTLKVWKYFNAGVREYWIVDPDHRQVMVYVFAGEVQLTTYSIHGKIPVGIYDGNLIIDFEKIWQRIRRFYPESSADLPDH